MPKKKGKKSFACQDFTLNDCANAPKPLNRAKKGTADVVPGELPWDELDLDSIDEIGLDGSKNLIYRKKQHFETKISFEQEIIYPEIVWYLISQFIKPEDVGRFACINKATYNITKSEYFWRRLYYKFCQNCPSLPDKLKLENSYKLYGLRQRVIRALYHTHDVFIRKVIETPQDSKACELVKRKCVSMWFCKEDSCWSIYFKLKKLKLYQKVEADNFIDELSRIDANPEEDAKVLQLTCTNLHNVPPLMGLTLSSVNIASNAFLCRRVFLGFNTNPHNISKHILPEFSLILDKVKNILIFDWWHPKYPYFDNKIPFSLSVENDEAEPALKKNFFSNDG